MQSCTLSLTSALDGVDYLRPSPAALPAEIIRYPLYSWLRGPQGGSGQVRKMSPQAGSDPRTVQPVAIPAHNSETHYFLFYAA